MAVQRGECEGRRELVNQELSFLDVTLCGRIQDHVPVVADLERRLVDDRLHDLDFFAADDDGLDRLPTFHRELVSVFQFLGNVRLPLARAVLHHVVQLIMQRL
jgi:hypothetical protein